MKCGGGWEDSESVVGLLLQDAVTPAVVGP
jgi:hypothetical protein